METFKNQIPHIIHGLKTAIAAILAYLIADALSLKFGYWASLSAVIVMQINVADSIRMCWYRFSGTAIGAVISILGILIFPPTHTMTLVSFFIAIAFCAYMTQYSSRFRMAAITTTIVSLASIGQANPIQFGMFRVVEIAVGVICAFLVSVLIYPRRAADTLKSRLRNQFEECSELYSVLMESFIDHQSKLPPDMLEKFSIKVAANREIYAKVMKHESMIYIENTNLLGSKVRVLEKTTSHLRAMLHTLTHIDGEGYEIIMEKELIMLANATTDAMQAISKGETPDEYMLQNGFNIAQKKLEHLRSQGATKRFYLEKMIQFFAFYHSAQFICKDLIHYTKHLKEQTDETLYKTY